MKILILNNRFPSEKKPFVAAYVKNIGKVLRNLGHEVDYLVDRGNSAGKTGQLKDLLIYYLRILFSQKFGKQDVIFVNHFHLFWWILRHQLRPQHKLIIHWHGSELKNSSGPWSFDRWKKDHRLLEAHHVFPSEYFRREVLKRLPGLKGSVIPSGGIDVETFKPQKKSSKADEVVVGFAGHLTVKKGADYLIELARDKDQLKKETGLSLRFRAINYGATDSAIPRKLLELGVELVPPMTRSEMPDYYNSLDVLIFPTQGDSLGLVPLEAMACDVPVICPNAFACPEYCISGVSGELYEQGNEQAFIEKLLKLMKNNSDYKPRDRILAHYSQQSAKEKYRMLLRQTQLKTPDQSL